MLQSQTYITTSKTEKGFSSLLTVSPAAQPCVTDSLVRLDDVSFLKNILYLSGSPLAVPETQLLLLESTFKQKTYI